MPSNSPDAADGKARVVVLTADAAFEDVVRATFARSGQIDLDLVPGGLVGNENALDADATVMVIDLQAANEAELAALGRITQRLGGRTPVVAITPTFSQELARRLVQLRVADFLAKPVQPLDLVQACARVVQAPGEPAPNEAEIFTFLPAVGGAGVTTLAIQSALMLLESGNKTRSTCLVDLNFQHGACADYLDLEPRLDLKEIEPRPERLDRQLLEVMLAHHSSGLAVIAAPNRPAEMRLFDPDMVARLLDLVSAHFASVVIDMPRTWFSWTDNVLIGSDHVFIVSETTVPAIKQAKQLLAAIRERLGEGARPKVILNRFEQQLFGPGLRKADVVQALGDDFGGTIANDYRLVREAIDRGVPLQEVKAGNKVAADVRRLIVAPREPASAKPGKGGLARLGLSWAKG